MMRNADRGARPTVTLVVPNRNHARYLPECLGSIAAQTHLADEVIVIDDASTDDSVRVIERSLAGRPTWRLVKHDERRGVVAVLNDGLAQARGDWIAFLGADDLLAPNFLEAALPHAAQAPHAAFVCACAAVLDGGAPRKVRPAILPRTRPGYVSADRMRELLRTSDNFFVGTVALYRRDALAELGGFDPSLGAMADGFLARRLAVRFGFSFVPAVLGYWRMHGDNYSVTISSDVAAVERMLARAREIMAAEPAGLFPPGYEAMLDRRVRFGCARLLTLDRSARPADKAKIAADLLRAGAVERCGLRILMACGRPGRVAALGWLVLRAWPYSPIRLGLEPFRRRAANASGRSYSASREARQ